jgi:hypothetical protein
MAFAFDESGQFGITAIDMEIVQWGDEFLHKDFGREFFWSGSFGMNLPHADGGASGQADR